MATVASNGMDPNDPNNQQPSTGGSGTVTNSTGGGAGTAGGGGAPAGAAPRANPSNTPNVQDYLNANQNAGQGLSNKIQSNVQNQANQVNTNLNTYQNQLNNSYQPLNTTTSQGQQTAQTSWQDPQALLAAYQASQSNPAGQATPATVTGGGVGGTQYQYDPATQQWYTPAQTANATTGSAAIPQGSEVSFQTAFGTPYNQQQALTDYNNLQGQIAGTSANTALNNSINQYGTSGSQDYGQLQNQLGTLNQVTGAAANPLGQNQLLQQAVGTPNYNMGQQSLDALFLQGQGNQLQQNLGQIQNQANNAVSGFQSNAAGTGYQNQLQALQNTAAGNVANTQQLILNGTWGGQPAAATSTSPTAPLGLNAIAANATTAMNSANAAAPGQLAALQTAAAANNGHGRFSAAQLAELGLTPGQQAMDVNLSGYINGGLNTPNQATMANVTSQDTLNRYNALNQIAGGPAGVVQPSAFGAGTTTAGGYNPVTFNNTGFQTAVQNQQQALTGDVSSALQGIAGQLAAGGINVQPYITGLNNGTMTPDQVNAALQRYINPGSGSPSGQPGLGNNGNIIGQIGGGAPGSSVTYSPSQMHAELMSELQPYTNAYNSYYGASGDVLGQNIGGLNPHGGGNAIKTSPITGGIMTGPNS